METTCNTCLLEHDEEIHAATERLHSWLRSFLAERLRELEPVEVEAA